MEIDVVVGLALCTDRSLPNATPTREPAVGVTSSPGTATAVTTIELKVVDSVVGLLVNVGATVLCARVVALVLVVRAAAAR